MRRVAAGLRRDGRYDPVLCAYLSVTPPSIEQVIDRLVRGGAGDIRVLPYFVLTGKHVSRHIPAIVRAARKKYRGVAKISLCPYLGYHDKLVSVVKQRIGEARHQGIGGQAR